MKTIGILVGGGPAPGINGVIGAATIFARRMGLRVIGIRDGFHWLMRSDTSHTVDLEIDDVSRIHQLGGSILLTSRANPSRDPADLERVVGSLDALGIDGLITVGGDDTCFSAKCVAEAAAGRIQVVHVPKTIDNDLPLPHGIPTFGFETARAAAAAIVGTLMEDARTAGRWYLVVIMGRKAGHLALGAAKSAGATLALVAEEFGDDRIRLDTVARIVEGSIAKRLASGRSHGVAILAEGIGERLDPAELEGWTDLPRDEHGHIRLAELPLGELVRKRVAEGLVEIGIKTTLVAKDVGYELRCAAPNAFDQDYTRDLGVGAVQRLVAGASAEMITRQETGTVPIPFDEILDPQTGRTRVRMLDTRSEWHGSARAFQVRMEADDLASESLAPVLTEITGLDAEALRKRYL